MHVRNPICHWFGCVPDYAHASRFDPGVVPCKRCGAPDTTYADRVGDTRHRRLMEAARFWCWRRWMPTKCPGCGHRYGSHAGCDVLPF